MDPLGLQIFFHGLQMPEAALEKRTQEKKQNPNHKANTLPQKNELQKITKKCILKQNPSSKNPFTLFFVFSRCFQDNINCGESSNRSRHSSLSSLVLSLGATTRASSKGNVRNSHFPLNGKKPKTSSTQKCHFFLGDMLFPTRVATEHVTFLCPKRAFVGCFFLPIGTACFTPPKGLKNKNMRQKLPNRGFFTE